MHAKHASCPRRSIRIPSWPCDPEALALRAKCVAALKRRIEHDALGRAGEHRAIRVGRAG
jgi:hypothetical protein